MDAPLEQIIEAAIGRLQDGKRVDAEALAAAHPEYAAELRELLPTVAMMVNLGAGVASDGDLPPSPNPSPPRGGEHDLPHQRLGDFRILRELGRGGMGTVYEAEQMSMGRRVALKVLPFAAIARGNALQRFRNEVRAAAALDHPHIVSVYSVGEERGVHYYAMQLVDGQTLADLIAELRRANRLPEPTDQPPTVDSAVAGPPSTQRDAQAWISTVVGSRHRAESYRIAARLGIEAAEAIQHAHDQGVLHRDIKPSNLLLDAEGKLYVTDFGLARIEADAGMTMTGDIVGTLRYMSPEQALAKRGIVDQRSDVYSLGLTLYELLTLQPAFTGDDRQELLRQIAFDEPRKLRQIDARIPHDLETIILRAIEKNPTERYATAQELADDLQRFLDDRSIRARRPTLLQRARKLITRHPTATTVTCAVIFLSIVVATAFLADRRRQRVENNRFLAASIQAARAALESNEVDEARRRLAEAEGRIRVGRLIDPAMANQVSELISEADRYAKFKSLLKVAQRNRADTERERTLPLKALALYGVMENAKWLDTMRRTSLPEPHVTRVADGVYELLLLMAVHMGRAPSDTPGALREIVAKEQPPQAIAFLDKAISFHAPSRGYFWLRANCALMIDDRRSEARLRKKALETPIHHAAELFYINRDRRWGLVSRGQPKYPVEQSYKDHREMLRQEPGYYNAFFFMAEILDGEGRHQEALPARYACVALQPDDWVAIWNRGYTHSRLGHVEEAIADYETVLTMRPNDAEALELVAWALATDRSGHIRDGKRAVELARKACELSNYREAHIVGTLAAAYAEAGDFASAVKWAEKALILMPGDREIIERLELYKQGQTIRDRKATLEEASRIMKSGVDHYWRGEYSEALSVYASVLATDPGYAQALDGTAWILAAAHDDKLRDGKRAVEFATEACQLTRYNVPNYIATLAAAYAEAGDFRKAVEWSQTAIEVAGKDSEDGKWYAYRMENYLTGRPWRMAEREGKPVVNLSDEQ
jgi:serine/threonine protein kinase/Flp pilus assembly protein TadD